MLSVFLTTLFVRSIFGQWCTTQVIDQSQPSLSPGVTTGGTTSWQSFVPQITGYLSQIDIRSGCGLASGDPNPATMFVYEGEGTTGTLLYSYPVSFTCPMAPQSFPLPTLGPLLVAGNTYTFGRTFPNLDFVNLDLGSNNPYTNGRFGGPGAGPNAVNYDMIFSTYMCTDVTPCCQPQTYDINNELADSIFACDIVDGSVDVSFTSDCTNPHIDVWLLQTDYDDSRLEYLTLKVRGLTAFTCSGHHALATGQGSFVYHRCVNEFDLSGFYPDGIMTANSVITFQTSTDVNSQPYSVDQCNYLMYGRFVLTCEID